MHLWQMKTWNFSLLFLLVAAVAATPILSAAPAPGVYWEWKGEIDQVQVNHVFRADDYRDIHVEPLVADKVVVPLRRGESRAAVMAVLPSLKPAFIEGLQKNLRARTAVPDSMEKALLIRVYLTKADPGTRTPHFVNFKALAAKLAVRGEVIDPASDRTLVEFKQERWAGLAEAGTSAQLLTKAAQTIGADVALLINSF